MGIFFSSFILKKEEIKKENKEDNDKNFLKNKEDISVRYCYKCNGTFTNKTYYKHLINCKK